MRNALANFSKSLDRVRDITVEVDASLSKALEDTRVLERHETIQCACAVIVSGYFESFLGDLAEAFVRDLRSLEIPFDRLPLEIRTAHFSDGGEFLAKQARVESKSIKGARSERILAETAGFTRRFASVVLSEPYELVSEAFVDEGANPGPQTLREFLNRFGVEKGWLQLATETGLSEQTLEASLKSFILIRNQCAHSGSASKVPTPSDVRDYCALVQTISTGIVSILEKHLRGPAFVGSTSSSPSSAAGS